MHAISSAAGSADAVADGGGGGGEEATAGGDDDAAGGADEEAAIGGIESEVVGVGLGADGPSEGWVAFDEEHAVVVISANRDARARKRIAINV